MRDGSERSSRGRSRSPRRRSNSRSPQNKQERKSRQQSRSISSHSSGDDRSASLKPHHRLRSSSRARSPSNLASRSQSPLPRAKDSSDLRQQEKGHGRSGFRKSRSPSRSSHHYRRNRDVSHPRSRSRGCSPIHFGNRQKKYPDSRSPRNFKRLSDNADKSAERDFRKESCDLFIPDILDSQFYPERVARENRTNDRSSKFNIPIRQPIPDSSEQNTLEPSPGGDEEEINKEKPNFGLSGLLTAETNTFNGVVVKYNEPPEAIKPVSRWRWYAFKGEEQIDILQLHRQSAYLIGKDRKVADIPLDHASISKQHAVLQYRKVIEKDPTTEQPRNVVKPYIIDLESTNGTFVNGAKIPSSRYFELKSADVIKFAFSSREYVFLQEE